MESSTGRYGLAMPTRRMNLPEFDRGHQINVKMPGSLLSFQRKLGPFPSGDVLTDFFFFFFVVQLLRHSHLESWKDL